MQKAISKTLVSVMVVLVMVLTAVQPIISNVGGTYMEDAVNGSPAESSVDAKRFVDSTAPPIVKMYSKVIVATTNVAELADYLSDFDYDGIIGAGTSNRNGIAFPVLSVPPAAIAGIASLPGVMGVYDYVDPVSSISTDGTAFSRSLLGLEPNSAVLDALNIESGSLYHGAEDAWANGFTGEGVKIATVTSGTDFGNAELMGRQAIISDPASPYYNYPIAFDPTSMSSYVADGLQSSTLNPADSWYVNTSSSDLHIYHTVVIDGVNDFWDEKDLHGHDLFSLDVSLKHNISAGTISTALVNAFAMKNVEIPANAQIVNIDESSWFVKFDGINVYILTVTTIDVKVFQTLSQSFYPLSQTSDKKAADPAEDMASLELDLTGLYVAQDKDNWFVGFDVASETDAWTRSYDVRYGLYIDAAVGGATVDPFSGSLITANAANRPEFAIFFHHVGVDWGLDQEGAVWTNNNTIKNATFHTWIGGAWHTMQLIGELPFNQTNGISPAAGSIIFADANGTKFVRHSGLDYRLSPDNRISFNGQNISIEMLTGTQAYAGDFVELSLPKNVMPGVGTFSTILFSAGANASHAQDTVPSDPAVAFTSASWDNNPTVLSAFKTINTPLQYVTAGVPSKSGIYKIGLHPDQNLMNQHYGRPVAVLLTDYYVSGVYDTVYVDLDNDKSFADERPVQKYGAYNDALMIGPRWGTQRFANNSVLHNGTWYQMKQYKISTEWSNETLTASAAGGETIFYLGNGSVNPSSLVIDRPAQHDFTFSNDSVVYTIDDTEVTPWSFFLPHQNIENVVIVVHYNDGADDYYDLLEDLDPTVVVDTATGELTFTDSSLWDSFLATNGLVSAEFYAWYDYSEMVDTSYLFDDATSKLTLNEALEAGDYLKVMYSYQQTIVEDITPANRYGTIIYKGNPVKLELRDWVSNKDIDAEGGKGDGMIYPDLSGGMVYYIADGTNPIPYMDIYWEWNSVEAEDRIIPGNGDMIAFFGEFVEASTQGTSIGATICAGGVMVDGHKEEIGGHKELVPNALVKGMAPGAKLISIRGGAFASWYFAVEGYDGIVGTADDAQIVAITSNFPVSTSGWDVYTKGAEYIGKYYAKGNVTFVAATGDNGFGYGTALSPGSSEATITSAQGTMFDYRCYNPGAPTELARVYADGGTNPHHGDVLPSAGRGPNMLGNPEPDVVTVGAFLFSSIPLNVDQDYTTPTDFDWYGGQWAWDLGSGNAFSAASTAGVLALIYDAFHQVNGRYPNNLESRSLIRSGADNLNYDTLVQGAGWTNADRSTQLAANLNGIYLDKTYWVPGDYRGVRYEGFVKLMEPGESASQPITITNKNPTEPTEIQVYDGIFHRFGEHTIAMNIDTMYDDLDTPGIINIEPYIAIGTELLKVTVTSARKATMQTYMAELFDWTDANGNGIVDFPTEQNRMTYVIGSNSLELRYRDPIGRVTDGLVVQVKGFGGSGEPLEDWTINMEFYEKVDWSWLTLANAPTNLAAGASATFNMNLNVPAYADVGSYEGAVYINEKVPEKEIAEGVGQMKYDVPFSFWTYVPGGGTEGIIDDMDLSAGNLAIIPKSTLITWNNSGTISYLYEGVDYTVSQYIATFVKEYPAGAPLPPGSPDFTISYLAVPAVNSEPEYDATWTGQLSIPNVVKDSYALKKDGAAWDEFETIVNEKVVNATGGETMASLYYRNVVRETTTLYLNGTEWPQDGGQVQEDFTPFHGQSTLQLPHGNVVPGSTTITLNSNILSQTSEVTILGKELVQGLNSTTSPGSVTFAQLGADVAGSVWDDAGTWYGKLLINADDTPDRSIHTSMVYADGVALIPGLDFEMHTGGVHGLIKFTGILDPATITYSSQYMYYYNNLEIGQLSHGQIISESYTLYLNGASMKSTEYFLDLETGTVTLMNPLGPNQIVEAAYKFNVYLVDLRSGEITLSDPLVASDEVSVSFHYFTYSLDMATGLLEFANPLFPGDEITADYTYARFSINMMKGIVYFASALLPGEIVTCEYYYYSNVIPVFFNIGAEGPDFSFGGPDPITPELAKNAYDDLFRYNEIRGGYGNEGDWRFIYMDVKEQGRYALPTDNERLFVDVEWEHDMTDVDVQVYGGRTALPGVYSGWPYDPLPSDRYGPHSVAHVGGSDVTSDFFTTTGGPKEITAPKISPGLNVIGLHTVGMNGADTTETFSAKVGTMYIDQTEVNIVTNQYVGETQIRMSSNMEWSGVGGIAAGPSAPESLKNLTVMQDDDDWSNYDTFEAQLASGTTVYSRTIKDCLIFNVHIWGHDNAPDLDLGVFLDGSGADELKDGKVQADEFVAYGADSDADEEVKLIAPKDGTYLIVIFGFTITTVPAHFDMDITIVQGTGFDLSGKGINSLSADQKGYFSSNQTERPYNSTYLNLKWDLPGSSTGTLQGALYLGPGNGPMCMLVPIVLTIDTTAPTAFDPLPAHLSAISNRRPNIVVSVSDFDRGELVPESMRLYLNGEDVTSQANINIPFIDDTDATLKGYVAGTALYVPPLSLADGTYSVKATIKDKAGNEASLVWAFQVDDTAPTFDVTYPAEEVSYTTLDTITVTGFTESGSTPRLIGATPIDTMIGSDGTFRMTISLEPGQNAFTFRAVDRAGNVKDVQRIIIRDSTLPTFTSVRFSTGSLTNIPFTTMSGKMSEPGTMSLNGARFEVNSDGSFERMIPLTNGRNTFHIEFTDRAGNMAHNWQNVTLDTIAPTISLTSAETKVTTSSLVLSGSVEANAELFINGKRISLGGTRQSTADFTTTLTLSEGLNTIVIEAKDGAGNVAEYRHVVEYNPDAGGTNWAAIGIMVALLVVGLILGLFLGPMILGGPKEETPEEELPEEELPEELTPEEGEVPLDEEVKEGDLPPEEAGLGEGEEVAADAEPIPAEESLPEELPAEESEVLPEEPAAEPTEPEDPRITKLRDAYESGKISKELYEKNLAKFKGQ